MYFPENGRILILGVGQMKKTAQLLIEGIAECLTNI